jgi:hypothetical protein
MSGNLFSPKQFVQYFIWFELVYKEKSVHRSQSFFISYYGTIVWPSKGCKESFNYKEYIVSQTICYPLRNNNFFTVMTLTGGVM